MTQFQTVLDNKQKSRALSIMSEYLEAPREENGKTPVELDSELDAKRIELINSILDQVINDYLKGETTLATFKSEIDSINKRNEYWGFKGIKGQMFFNMVVNVSDDLEECDQELKSVITVPQNEQIASSRIKTFSSYVNRLRDLWRDSGHTMHGAPKLGSIPFFVSYFWQIQSRDVWPVYYTTAINTMSDLNIWRESGNLAENYIQFKHVNEELVTLFSSKSGKSFNLYEVEHVFWYKSEVPYQSSKSSNLELHDTESQKNLQQSEEIEKTVSAATFLPESYIPPIVAILPQIANNENDLADVAKRSGISLERAFEKNIDAAFTILGYDTKLMGQGSGRVPDGIAIAIDENYAIIWDAKVRKNSYSMGTDDRVIREYIVTQSRELKRRRLLRNIYYCIVSSKFSDDFDEVIRGIKMDTDINEVCLVESGAIVAMVDAKLRTPLQISLGSDGIQRLFTNSGILTGEMVREYLF